MSNSILQNGYPSWEELKQFNRIPSDERFAKGPVAVIECIQPIPCNPCEGACKFGAICVGDPIINLPCLDEIEVRRLRQMCCAVLWPCDLRRGQNVQRNTGDGQLST